MKVNILKFDHFGRGIGKINNKVVFVNKALPHELVDIKIIKENNRFQEGIIKKIISPSSERINAICPYYNKCGGCNFLHTTYNYEKEFKIAKAKELLGRCDNFYETLNLNYRNKVTLHVKKNQLGFYLEKSNELINVDYCYLLNDRINEVIAAFKKIDLNKYKFKNIIIKSNQNQTLLYVDNDVDDNFIDCFRNVDTIISNNNTVKGTGFIEEIINNRVFKITAKAFFQVNKEGLENIYSIITDFLWHKKINSALDLYSGTSVWAILISDFVKNIISVEINREATINAHDNMRKNNISNIKVINGDVSDYIDKFKNIDLIIVDPPRNGLDKKTQEYIKQIASKYVIYISCDMLTLKRDIIALQDKYQLESIHLVDMFKRTYHCESIVILEKKH